MSDVAIGSLESCTCKECQSACKQKPGWFIPGEAEKAAEFLGLSLEEFFKQYLLVDYWTDYPEDTFLLSPAIKRVDPGGIFPANPKGECVFFEGGRCKIHPVKPNECRRAIHDGHPDDLGSNYNKQVHEPIAIAWKPQEHQQQIVQLLGEKPCAPEWSMSESLSWL